MAPQRPSPQAPPSRQWWPAILRGTALTLGTGLVIVFLASLVFWDANFYVARDRWEHFKLALLGEWHNTGWCPSGQNIPGCMPKADLEAAFSKVDNLHFFKLMPVEGTSLTVTTGANFASAQDVLAGKAASQWCYIAYGDSAVKTHLDLAEQSGTAPPRYATLSDVKQKALSNTGLDVAALRVIAKTHCQFGVFNQPTSKGA